MKIIGHEAQQEALLHLLKKQSLAHALLFSGPHGVGKRQVALGLAKSLLCEKEPFRLGGCEECHSCHVFEANNQPNLYQADCAETNTEAVRELLKKLHLVPFGGKNRVVVLDNAEKLHGQAANALLKSLEEPRPGTYFILVTAKPNQLLTTIRSRAQNWSFHTLTKENLTEILRIQPDAIDHAGVPLERLLVLADGSFETLETMLESQELLDELSEKLSRIAAGDRVLAIESAETYGKMKESFNQLFALMRVIARERISEGEDTLRWANFLSEILCAERLIMHRNLSPVYTLSSILLRLAERHQIASVMEPGESFHSFPVS